MWQAAAIADLQSCSDHLKTNKQKPWTNRLSLVLWVRAFPEVTQRTGTSSTVEV